MSASEDEIAPGGFSTLGLDTEIVLALTGLGYEEPTPIQREAIPPLIAGRDVLGQAATGTGKTAAFALPLIQSVQMRRTSGIAADGQISALVLTPTRELAIQVAEAIHKYGRAIGVTVLPIYGGADMRPQLRALSRGVEIVVATPGRAMDHIRRKSLVLSSLRTIVLDEADEMLDLGFADDLEAIFAETPTSRQTALFSATMPPRVISIAKRHLRDPIQVSIARSTTAVGTTPKVRQIAYIVSRAQKPATLGRVLDMEAPSSAIVFCRTRTEVDELTETLTARGYRAESLHGGMSQEQRDRVMKKFRANALDLLIATDVAARGLDIAHLSHVVNYDVPMSPDAYVHRIGRTGRAGRTGVAITLAEPREHGFVRNIERATKQKIEIATIPTVADLRARRLELTRDAIRETLLAGELASFRVVIESLADGDFDILDVAAAAIKTAHEALGNTDADESEITVPATPSKERKKGTKKGPAKTPTEWNVTRLYIGGGRKGKIRPGDIVGAIANEVGIDSGAVGAIEIYDRFALVEVPEEIADDIVQALQNTTIKGKRLSVRRDRGRSS